MRYLHDLEPARTVRCGAQAQRGHYKSLVRVINHVDTVRGRNFQGLKISWIEGICYRAVSYDVTSCVISCTNGTSMWQNGHGLTIFNISFYIANFVYR